MCKVMCDSCGQEVQIVKDVDGGVDVILTRRLIREISDSDLVRLKITQQKDEIIRILEKYSKTPEKDGEALE